MNKNISHYNTLCDKMLELCFSSCWFPGVWEFLDNKGLISIKLTRDGDDIHLGEKGIALLVRKFKLWIFEREVIERRASVSSRQPQHRKVGSSESA